MLKVRSDFEIAALLDNVYPKSYQVRPLPYLALIVSCCQTSFMFTSFPMGSLLLADPRFPTRGKESVRILAEDHHQPDLRRLPARAAAEYRVERQTPDYCMQGF
jgi:hypothetical protein